MSQIALPLDWPPDEQEERFLLGEANAEAARHLEHWSLWPLPVTILHGPRQSGRSTLGRIFARKTGGRLIDDAWRAPEEDVFHAWNAAVASRRPLLIVADAVPPEWQVVLPDLASRLSATPRVAIAEPDDALAAALIEAQLGRRGLPSPQGLAGFLLPRVERSYVTLLGVVDLLDRAAIASRARLTLPFARRTLAAAGVIDASYSTR